MSNVANIITALGHISHNKTDFVCIYLHIVQYSYLLLNKCQLIYCECEGAFSPLCLAFCSQKKSNQMLKSTQPPQPIFLSIANHRKFVLGLSFATIIVTGTELQLSVLLSVTLCMVSSNQ